MTMIETDAPTWKLALLSCFPSRIYAREIPNGYCSEVCCKDRTWLIVTTEVGHIKIGPRKRVIVIDWSDSDVDTLGVDLFPGEDTTKQLRSIHAWGIDKAKEYVARILQCKRHKGVDIGPSEH